jgi:hypothetical protein
LIVSFFYQTNSTELKGELTMSKQTDYTPEEWKSVTAAPVMAGLLVSMSDMSGPIGLAKEAFAVVKAVTDTAAGTSNELIRSIAEGIKAQGGRPEMPAMPGDLAGTRAALLDGVKQAAAIVERKSPAEAEGYKRWLVSLAQNTADAAKEGGFLGIGGTQVSEDESSAVAQLALALGVKA